MLVEAVMVVSMAALLPLQGFGCGVEWKVPKDHFDGVNEYGYVSYWDKIGDLDLGEGLVIPLSIGFQSDREWSSPYLGYGWMMPLFDSNIVQTGENSFELTAPDGYTMPFGRDGNKPTVLNGVKGWKGEISSDTITLWASCGWKLTYKKGKISSIGSPTGKSLLISRDSDGVATEASYDGKVLIRTQRDFNGVVTGVILGEKPIEFEQAEKPRIQSVQGKNLVAGKDLSLATVKKQGNIEKTFVFTVSPELQPKLLIRSSGTEQREIVWDAATRLMRSDGPWAYDIKQSLTKGYNASITRRNKSNQEEVWFLDSAGNQEITQTADGIKKIITWFPSGKLAGKRRNVTEIKNGKSELLYQASYDEAGHFLRGIYSNGDIVTYKSEGNQTTMLVNGIPRMSTTYNKDGTIAKEVFHDMKSEKQYAYENGYKKVTTLFSNGEILKETFNSLNDLATSQQFKP